MGYEDRYRTTDPRRWPKTPSDYQSILDRNFGFPDSYAIGTYGAKIENTVLARGTNGFIRKHVESEKSIISQVIHESDPGTRSMIDAGSRDGRLYSELVKPGVHQGIEFKNYFGIDFDEKAIALLRRRLEYDSTAHAVLGDITKLDKVLSNINDNFGKSEIQSPIVCIMQNTLGTISENGSWREVIVQLKKILDSYPKAEVILSLYKSINPALTVEEIGEALKTIEKFSGQNNDEAFLRINKAIQLLGNGWLLPSYLYTKAYNGWPPSTAKLGEKLLYIPETGYVSRQWSKEDIVGILKELGAKVIRKREGKEFIVLRLGRS